MKYCLSLIISFLLLFSLIGCQSAYDNGDLTKELREELMHTIIMNTARWDPEKPGEDDLLCADGNIYYMGTYGRYDVLFYDSSQFASWRERIGEELFYDNQYSNIYLIGNGEKIMLRKAYSQGLVRDRDLFDLAKHFYQFQISHAINPSVFTGGYGYDFVTRYASEDDSDIYVPRELGEDRKKELISEIIYMNARENGCDIQRPGRGVQIFADNPYYIYLGTYADASAVLFHSDVPAMGIYGEIVVGAELFRCANFFEIILYRDLEGVGIADAYEQGWISVEDLFTLAKRFYQFQLENAEDPDAVRQLYGDYAARYESP